jgi:hypothetical protein
VSVTQYAMGVVLCCGAVASLAGCVADDLSDIGRVFSTPTPDEAARDALDPYDPNKRREGVVLLATATFGGAAPYTKLYRDYTEHDPDPLVKAAAITALGRHGTPDDALIIAPWLSKEKSTHQHVRWCAALALQRLHNPKVVPDLIRSLSEPREISEVQEAVCVALAQYPQDRVVQGLMPMLDARDLAVSAAAAESLHLLTGQDWGTDPRAWSTWYRGALASGSPFGSQLEYLYPTYHRDKVWWEHAAFWIDQQWEVPQPPAGAPTSGRRATWGNAPEGDG